MKAIKRTERGWAGHFCCAQYCLFRRNTLLEYADQKIVVSSVGNYTTGGGHVEDIGLDRYYETMAFIAEKVGDYWEADTSQIVYFESPWGISEPGKDNEANSMHENIVAELEQRMLRGQIEVIS